MEQTQTAPPPPPPPSGPIPGQTRPPLRRATESRWVAGVGSGLARHLGIDPVIVRIAIVALVFMGGTGFAVYGLGWLLIPADGESQSLAQKWTRGGDGRWRFAGVAGVVLGGILLAGALGSGEIIVPLLLVAAGAWLLIRSDDDGPSPSGEPGRGAPTDLPAGADQSLVSAGTDAGGDPTFVAPAPPVIEDAPTPRSPSFLTPLVLAVVMLIAGASVLASKAELFDVSVSGVLTVCLLVVGLGLLVSVRWGRARGLIPLGLVLAAGVGIASLFSFPLWSGIGERVVRVDERADIDGPIHHGIGTLDVDLRDLDLDGDTARLEVGVSLGELVVVVPDDVDVEFAGEVSAGEITVFGRTVDGIDRTLSTDRDGGSEPGTLVIDAQVGLGELRVESACCLTDPVPVAP